MSVSQRFRAKLICEAIKPYISENTKVLDIGCGNGAVTEFIEFELKWLNRITGTDVLDYRKEALVPNFKLMPSVTQLPFKDNEFDVGLILDVIHHINKDKQIDFIKEAMRVCKKVLIWDLEPTTLAKATCYVANLFYTDDMHVPLSHRSLIEWRTILSKDGIEAKWGVINKPFWYPYDYFLIDIVGGEK